jgi:hypothetical protein
VKERRRARSSASSPGPWESTSIKASREGKARFPTCFSRKSSASVFHRVDCGTVDRLLDQAHSGGVPQLGRVMPACPIDLHDDEALRECLAHMLQEEIHHGGIRAISKISEVISRLLGSHSRVDIHVLSHHLAGGVWPDPRWSETSFRAAHTGHLQPSSCAMVSTGRSSSTAASTCVATFF